MTSSVETPPTGRRARSDRVLTAVVALGLALGAGLTVFEIVDRPPVELGEERTRIDGLRATVQVLATNTSDTESYCVQVRIAAIDSEGLDLQDVPAAAVRGGGRLPPRQSINFRAEFDGLDETDLRERLDEFGAYVDHLQPC